MNAQTPPLDELVDYLQARLADGSDGKALLLGFAGPQALLALSAGLRGEQDHPGFLTFCRYLLHQRFDCDGHALMLPAAVSGEPVYMLETHLAGAAAVHVVHADGRRVPWPHDDRLIGDLTSRESALPGIQRREMDRLYETLRLALP